MLTLSLTSVCSPSRGIVTGIFALKSQGKSIFFRMGLSTCSWMAAVSSARAALTRALRKITVEERSN